VPVHAPVQFRARVRADSGLRPADVGPVTPTASIKSRCDTPVAGIRDRFESILRPPVVGVQKIYCRFEAMSNGMVPAEWGRASERKRGERMASPPRGSAPQRPNSAPSGAASTRPPFNPRAAGWRSIVPQSPSHLEDETIGRYT
jgi:hypothetical protein